MKFKEISLGIYYEPYIYGIDKNKYFSEEAYLSDCRKFFMK